MEANEFVGMTLPFVGDNAAYTYCQSGGSNSSGGNMPDFSAQVLIGQYAPDNNPDMCSLGAYFSILSYNNIQLYNNENFVINYNGSIHLYSAPKNCTVIYKDTGAIIEETIKFYKLTPASDVTLPIDINDVSQVEVTDAEEIEVEFDYDAETMTLSYTIPDIDSTHEILGIDYQISD
jgi:hypothetical protein